MVGAGAGAPAAAANHAPSTRSEKLRKLHHTQRIPAKDAVNSNHCDDMPNNNDEEADPENQRHVKWYPSAWLTCLSSLQHELTMAFPHDWWTSWFCQYLGLTILALSDSQRICACEKFILDPYGDHSHTCSQHSGTTKDAHEHILSALDTMCRRSGYTNRRKNVTSRRGSKKGDLEIRDINLAGKRDLVIDVALVYDFSGDCSRDARRNGQLRYDDPDLLLNNAARAKVHKYREDSSASDVNKAFLSALLSTSGRIHGEFLRLLYILAHRQTVKFFETVGEEPSNEAFTWRRAESFFHDCAAIGIACAQATALRTHVAPHTARRLPLPLSNALHDPLLLPVHPPRSA